MTPNLSRAHSALGSALAILEQYPEALQCGQKSIALDPANGIGHFVLGICYKAQGRLDEAIASLKASSERLPKDPRPLRTLTSVLYVQKRFQDVIVVGSEAIALDPNHIDTLKFVGSSAQRLGHHEVAVEALDIARELAPHDANALAVLGLSLYELGRFREARDVLREGSRLSPRDPSFPHNLGAVFKDSGEPRDAIREFRAARRIRPAYTEALNNELCCTQYLPEITLAKLAETHREYQSTFVAPLKSARSPSTTNPDPDRPLRIGLVGGDFHFHPVGKLTIAAMERLDGDMYQVACYSNGHKSDGITERFQKMASIWRGIRDLSDQDLCRQIIDDRIDILIDLAGHTSRNRLLLFARKPAPVQATWLGYSGTTGVSTIDHLIVDAHHIPSGMDELCCVCQARISCTNHRAIFRM